jgi:hypothetical protein
MRFRRRGKRKLLVLELVIEETRESLCRLYSAIETAFRSRHCGQTNDGVLFKIAGRVVNLDYEILPEISFYTAEAEDEGILYDIANYLGAHAAELGIVIEREV